MRADCTVFRVVDFASKKWSILILLELYKGVKFKKRYSELKRGLIGITPKVLSARLKELERNGLIERKIDVKAAPLRSNYALTARGKDFIKVIKEIKNWGVKWGLSTPHCREHNCRNCEF